MCRLNKKLLFCLEPTHAFNWEQKRFIKTKTSVCGLGNAIHIVVRNRISINLSKRRKKLKNIKNIPLKSKIISSKSHCRSKKRLKILKVCVKRKIGLV